MQRPSLPRLAPLLSLFAAVLVACSSGGGDADDDDEDGDASSTLERSISCAQTACAASYEHCRQTREECTDTCISGRIEDVSLCFDICTNIECDTCGVPDTSPCVSEGYHFKVTGTRNVAVERACEHYELAFARCADEPANLDCQTLARTARPAASTMFDCASTLACGDTTSCFDTLPTSDLGQAICGAIERRCPLQRCSAESPANLDTTGAWLRDDAAIAALECTAEHCSSIWPCLDAWSAAIR